MKTTHLYKHLVLIIFFILLFSCSRKKEEQPGSTAVKDTTDVRLTDAQFKTAGIELGKLEQHVLSDVLKVNGKLDVPPQNLISVSAPFGGFLQSTEMLQGKPVKKGERIAVIQNPEYVQLQQDYLDNNSQLEFLETEYRRQVELSKENVNAQKTLQQSKAAYFSKLATVKGLHAKLKILNIDFTSLERGEITNTINLFSPISGFVTEVNFNIGSFVNPTDVLFKIVDTSHLHAEVTVFERDIIKIRRGQKIRFTLPGNTRERSATVYLIGKEILPDRTVRIHGHLDEEDQDLLPGMYLNAVIELGSKTVDALPDEAIVNFEGKHYIFVAEADSHFTKVEIGCGASELGYTEVMLPDTVDKSKIKIVVKGAYSLLSKMKNNGEEE